MRVGGEQWISGGGSLYSPGNLGHATQNLIVGSKRHRMEGKGFPVKGETECDVRYAMYSPEVDGREADRTNGGIRDRAFSVGEEDEDRCPLGCQS